MCFWPVSGKGSNLTDGSTNTCVTVPSLLDGPSVQYTLAVNNTCIHGNHVNVSVTTKSLCDEIRSVVLMDRVSTCNGKQASRCEVINSNEMMCELRCKCAESANQCLIHLYSGVGNQKTEICKIYLK